jgi:hypothetical protein
MKSKGNVFMYAPEELWCKCGWEAWTENVAVNVMVRLGSARPGTAASLITATSTPVELRVRVYEDSFLYRPGPAKVVVLKTVLKKL